MAISKFKNRKATGHDQILVDLIKWGGKELKEFIYELIYKIWAEEVISQEWEYGIICPIHKKGDVMLCDNAREFDIEQTVHRN